MEPTKLNFTDRLNLLYLADKMVGRNEATITNRQDIVFETYKKLLPEFEVTAEKNNSKRHFNTIIGE